MPNDPNDPQNQGPDVEVEADDQGPDDAQDREDEDHGEDEDGEGDDSPAVKPDGSPYTAKDIAALNLSLKNARQAERSARRAAKADPAAAEDAASKAVQDAEAKYKPIVVRQAARAAFADAGLVLPKGKEAQAVQKALKLLDMDQVDLTDDGEVDGLAEQIDELRETFPELFHRKGTRRVDGADRGGPPAGNQSSASRLGALLRS